MRKIKQILSVALASAMLMGLTVTPASAYNISSETTNTNDLSSYKDSTGTFWTKLPFDKILTVDKNMNIPAGTKFTFSMEPRAVSASDKVNGEQVQQGTPLSNATVEISYNNDDIKDLTPSQQGSTTVTATKVGVFELPTFTEKGIYRYTVKEVVPVADKRQSYITYDTTDIYRVDLYVTKESVNGENKVGITSIVAVDLTDTTKKDNIIFRNEIGSAGLTIKKEITGNGQSANDEFAFYIKIPEGGDNLTLDANTSFQAVYHKNDSTTEDITINVAGTKDDYVVVNSNSDYDSTYTGDDESKKLKYISTTTGANYFTLKGGESLTFTNLPVGMIFYVTEANYMDDGYMTTASYIGTNTDGTTANSANFAQGGDEGTQTKGTIAAGTNTMTFTNSKTLTPDTGVNVDVLPYVLAMLLTVAGIVLFVFKKRRNTR